VRAGVGQLALLWQISACNGRFWIPKSVLQ
jgi:hypothetical protein